MDLSTPTDTHQQRHHHQQYLHQAYDPSQVQAYYTYPHQYDQQHANQQHYPYYPPDYANIYQQQPPQEPTSIHPPGVPIPPETTTHLVAPEYGQTHLQNQQNAYYPQPVVAQQHQQFSNSDSGGLNSAVAVFPQWQGNGGGFGPMQVHDGSGSMPPPIGQSPYMGGGRRGGRPFRGGFRGRGRGRGSGRLAPSEGPVHSTPSWPPPCMAWCELCRVDCNTLEILEQHKNGKRHKKNLQVYEELQNLNKLITGMQNPQIPVSEFKPEVVIQPEKVEGYEEKQTPPENLPSEPIADDNRIETGQQKESVEKSLVSAAELTEEPERKPRMDHFEARGRGFKHTMRGRGGKRMRTTEGPRRPVEHPKLKQVIPLICELCNVKCDSQVVFDSHLAGKKHISNLKKYHGYQAILGAVVLQALCQPNPNAPSTSFIPQVHQQGFHDPQSFSSQQVPYMLPQAQAPAPAVAAAAAPTPTPAPVPVLETQNSITVEATDQLKYIEVEVKSPLAVSNDTKTENEVGSSDQAVLPGLDCKMEEPIE